MSQHSFILGVACCKPAGVVRGVARLLHEYLLLGWLQVEKEVAVCSIGKVAQ